MSIRYLATMAILASTALAKTDLTGCTSSDSVVTPSGGGTPYATRVYYVPDTGEICAALDCGGGRAPPKTTVPGCPSYEGTETYSPSFLPLKTTSAVAAQSTQATVMTTMTPKGDSTASASASGSASVTAAADSSSMSGSKSDDVQVQTDTLLTVTSSMAATTAAPGNGTIATTSRSGSRTTGTGSGASGSPTSVPNGAAAGVSNMFGLMAGVALGAAALL